MPQVPLCPCLPALPVLATRCPRAFTVHLLSLKKVLEVSCQGSPPRSAAAWPASPVPPPPQVPFLKCPPRGLWAESVKPSLALRSCVCSLSRVGCHRAGWGCELEAWEAAGRWVPAVAGRAVCPEGAPGQGEGTGALGSERKQRMGSFRPTEGQPQAGSQPVPVGVGAQGPTHAASHRKAALGVLAFQERFIGYTRPQVPLG